MRESHRPEIRRKILVAAGIMLQTVHRRGRQPWTPDTIVDPRLRGGVRRGRFTKPGLLEAVDAMRDLIALDGLPVHKASQIVAAGMEQYWVEAWAARAERSDTRERLNSTTLASQIRSAYYHQERAAKPVK